MADRVILDRILQLEPIKQKILNWQLGFSRGYGTPEQLHRVVNFSLDAMEQKMYAVLFL